MKTRLVLLFTALSALSALGQDAKANVTPPEAEAGKPITIILTVDKPPSVENTAIGITLAPKEPKDNGTPYGVNLSPKNTGSNIYVATTTTPPNAKGTWYVRDAYSSLPVVGGSVPIELVDHPEFTIKPVEITLPKTGKVQIAVP